MKKLKSLSVFFPSFNDAKILPYLIVKTYEVLPEVSFRSEVIVINDGSSDDTKEVLTQLKKHYKNLRIVNHKKNLGYGVALQSGIKAARYEWIFYTDGDGQYDPGEITKLVQYVDGKVDVVNGYKIKRSDPILRVLLGSFYNWGVHHLHKLPIRDVDCDFRLMRSSKVKSIRLISSSGAICLELVRKLVIGKAVFKEVPVHHMRRTFGNSRFFTLRNLISMLAENVKYLKIHR